uniref:Uncharacterized protein n=1 Tax=Physcomitrium patens TaxID=3218 RepID=A0A7I4BBY4_PHYPA
MFYGAMIWDPWLILAQIVCIQSLYYMSLGIFLWAFVGTQVPELTLKYFFNHSLVTGASVVGWSVIAAYIVNSLCGFLWWFVFILCVVITALFGEWLCMRRELKDIPMRSTRLGYVLKHPSSEGVSCDGTVKADNDVSTLSSLSPRSCMYCGLDEIMSRSTHGDV